MKLASLKKGGRDGTLIVVSRDNSYYSEVGNIATTLQYALENWLEVAPKLQEIYSMINSGQHDNLSKLKFSLLASPLPRAYQWLDGSAYLSHVERVRKARGAEMPESFLTDPLMYQGGSDYFLGPTDTIEVNSEDWGIDFESEVAIVTTDVNCGISSNDALSRIALVMLVNDVSLRKLIPDELAKGFGFIHGKPPTAFSPIAVTPDEISEYWQESRLHLPLLTKLNGVLVGDPNAGIDMQFGFNELIAHAAKTRPLTAGTIIGSGTVSNYDQSRGISCLAERRVLEIIENGEATTEFLKYGDQVRIEMLDKNNQSIFGAIEQIVQPCPQ